MRRISSCRSRNRVSSKAWAKTESFFTIGMNDQMTVRSSPGVPTTRPFFPVSRHFLTIPATFAGRMWIGSSFPSERASTCAAALQNRSVPSPENSRTG